MKSDLNPELHDAEQYIYQQQHISEKDYKFLKELEHVLGECIPCLNEIQWGDTNFHSFGFVVRDNHIMGLGLTMKLIREIPESIGNLTHLEILTIDKCVNLRSLPESIIYLKKLKYFQFNGVRLPPPFSHTPRLPDSICNLRALEKLDISFSEFDSLPECLGYLPNLKEINISGCPDIQNMPKSLKDNFKIGQYQKGVLKFLIRKEKPILDKKVLISIEPETLYTKFIKNHISKDELVKILSSIIEDDTDLERRVESIKIILKIALRSEVLFKILENLIVSDESALIRKTAIEAIVKLFPEQGIKPCEWILLNEPSIDVRCALKDATKLNNNELTHYLMVQYRDLFSLMDIENLIRVNIPKVDSIVPKRYKWGKEIGLLGYVSENHRIIELSLNHHGYFFSHLLNTLPGSIGNLTSLEVLNLSDCKELHSLPQSIGNLRKLKILICKGCSNLTSLPQTLGQLSDLEVLDLNNCMKLESLPFTIGALKNLVDLNLKACKTLEVLPDSIRDMSSLKKLNLENCWSIKCLPDTLKDLHSIISLNLQSCRSLETLPEQIGEIESIEDINLKGCLRLKSLPNSIGNFEGLKSLDLSYCYNLNNLPPGLKNLVNLNILNLTGCREIKEIPIWISKLQNLQGLILTACIKLRKLPKSIGELKRLKELDITYCESLKNLPENIDKLSLKKFRFGDNQELTKSSETIRNWFETHNPYSQLKDIQGGSTNDFKILQVDNDIREEYIDQGVDLNDLLVLLSIYKKYKQKFTVLKIHEPFNEIGHYASYVRINKSGKVIALCGYYSEGIYFKNFPEDICWLDQLEELELPLNIFKSIPICIKNLKFLVNLNLKKLEEDFIIPSPLEPFVKTLEKFNQW